MIPDSLYSRYALMITGRKQAGMTTFYECITYDHGPYANSQTIAPEHCEGAPAQKTFSCAGPGPETADPLGVGACGFGQDDAYRRLSARTQIALPVVPHR
jgi:hypothetical protein